MRSFCRKKPIVPPPPEARFAKKGFSSGTLNQKNPRVRKIRVRNSGAGNGCANFMDAWKKCVLSAGKTHVHKIPRVLGGGGEVFWVSGGGGEEECRFYFYGRADFSD